MANGIDLDVQVRAYIDRAASEGGVDWLRAIRNQALDAVTAGDVEVTTLSFEGGAAGGTRSVNAQQLLEITQTAIERMEGCEPPAVASIDYRFRRVES